jgi:hypothetical protein
MRSKKKQRVESTIKVWFQLVDSTGNSYNGTTADKVSLSTDADVIDFRDAVKGKHSNKLASVDADELVVYRNSTSFEMRSDSQFKEEPLEEESPIDSLGGSKTDALIVVVPLAHGRSHQGF